MSKRALISGYQKSKTFLTFSLLLAEEFLIEDLFLNSNRVGDFLQDKNLTSSEASGFMSAGLILTNLFFQLDSHKVKLVTCNPELLATFLVSDDLDAVIELSNVLCNLDSSQVSHLIKVVHENLDISGLLDRGKSVANKTLNYNMYSLTNDAATFVENLWNTTAFRDVEIPPMMHMKEWSEDFGTLLDSAMNSDDIDFKV